MQGGANQIQGANDHGLWQIPPDAHKSFHTKAKRIDARKTTRWPPSGKKNQPRAAFTAFDSPSDALGCECGQVASPSRDRLEAPR